MSNEKDKLLPCPFCGGPAEKRLTDGPRGFLGCFTCMIGLPFNAPYGNVEIKTWNTRVSANVAPIVDNDVHDWLKEQCARLMHGLCTTARCLKRGGYPLKGYDASLATCEAYELSQGITVTAESPELEDSAPLYVWLVQSEANDFDEHWYDEKAAGCAQSVRYKRYPEGAAPIPSPQDGQ